VPPETVVFKRVFKLGFMPAKNIYLAGAMAFL
jgi:hypothetical protein